MKRRVAGFSLLGGFLVSVMILPKVFGISIGDHTFAPPDESDLLFELVVPGGHKTVSIQADKASGPKKRFPQLVDSQLVEFTFEDNVAIRLPGNVQLRVPKGQVKCIYDRKTKESHYYIEKSSVERPKK